MNDVELIEAGCKWSGQKFLIGWAKIITNRAFVAWVVFMWIGVSVLKYGKDSIVDIIMASGCVAVTLIYILGAQGFNKLLGNSKAEFRIGMGKG